VLIDTLPAQQLYKDDAFAHIKSKPYGHSKDLSSASFPQLIGLDQFDDEQTVELALQEVLEWQGSGGSAVWTRPAYDGLAVDIVVQAEAPQRAKLADAVQFVHKLKEAERIM